jgi:hypothetical protein
MPEKSMEAKITRSQHGEVWVKSTFSGMSDNLGPAVMVLQEVSGRSMQITYRRSWTNMSLLSGGNYF